VTIADADILDRLYAGPVERDAFDEAQRMIRERLGANSINIRHFGEAAPLIVTGGPLIDDPASKAAYFGYWSNHDSHFVGIERLGADGRVYRDDDLITPDDAERDVYLNEFYRPAGCGSLMGFGRRTATALTVFGAIREPGQIAFGEQERRDIEGLRDHMIRALKLGAKVGLSLQQSATDLANALEADGAAVLRCDADGRIVFVAPGAERILAASRAVRLRLGRLVWNRPVDHDAFRRMCHAGANRLIDPPFAMLVHDGEDNWLRIIATPAAGPGAAALVVIRRIARAPAVPADLLRRMFGLSVAESRLALAVSEGGALPAIAETFGVSHSTLRSQLRSVFLKVGVRRQAELAALIARIA